MTSVTSNGPMENNNNVKKSIRDIKIGNQDLQLLLRSRIGPQCTIVRSAATDLLPPGENFACLLYQIDAVIKKNDNSMEDQEMKFVAKMFPTAPEILKVFDFSSLFKKEIFFYEKFSPKLKELEIEFGVPENEAFDILPKLYGVRRSWNFEENTDRVDDGAVILMENLNFKGYYMLNKRKGLDLNHSRFAVKYLARLHALAVACKRHRPDFFKNEVLAHAKVIPFQEDENNEDFFDAIFNMLCKDDRIAEFSQRIKKLMSNNIKIDYFTLVADEPWLSIAHCDFWTNNILFHKDVGGNLDDVKFIDFQNYTYNSPLRDLPYFLCTSTEEDVMKVHFDELLDLYYDTFAFLLKRMNCNVEAFSRESFDKQLKIDAKLEFFHNVFAIKFFSAEINSDYDASQFDDIILYSQINKLGYEKWFNIIQTYVKKQWL